MKIAVIGTGYVGLVTGTCLAESGNDVVCVDQVAEKIARLKQGVVNLLYQVQKVRSYTCSQRMKQDSSLFSNMTIIPVRPGAQTPEAGLGFFTVPAGFF